MNLQQLGCVRNAIVTRLWRSKEHPMAETKLDNMSIKPAGGVGKGFFTPDASTVLKGPSVDSSTTRGAKPAPCPKPLGPRNA